MALQGECFEADFDKPNMLVPADADSVFICAKRSGAVIGVRQVKEEGKKTEIVGILQGDEAAPDKHAAVRWMIERIDGSEEFFLLSKELGRFLMIEDIVPEKGADLVFAPGKSNRDAVRLRFESTAAPMQFSIDNIGNVIVPDPPRPTKLDTTDYPLETTAVCVSSRFVPYFAVSDPLLPSWEARVKNNPIYQIRVYQQWKREWDKEWDGKSEHIETVLTEEEVASSFTHREVLEVVSQKGSMTMQISSLAEPGLSLLSPLNPSGLLSVSIAGDLTWEAELKRRIGEQLSTIETRKKTQTSSTIRYAKTSVPTLYTTWYKWVRMDLQRMDHGSGKAVIVKAAGESRETRDPTQRKDFSFP